MVAQPETGVEGFCDDVESSGQGGGGRKKRTRQIASV